MAAEGVDRMVEEEDLVGTIACEGAAVRTSLEVVAEFLVHRSVEEADTCPEGVDLEEEEKPQSKAVNYIVEAAAQVLDKKALGQKEISVVFCVD